MFRGYVLYMIDSEVLEQTSYYITLNLSLVNKSKVRVKNKSCSFREYVILYAIVKCWNKPTLKIVDF
jgi:hypothetical protein